MRSHPSIVSALDYHVCGEPLRILPGIRPLAGTTMGAKAATASHRLDDLRRLVVNEPRGHADMFGVILTEPTTAGCLFGALFFDRTGFKPTCGHGTIALATAAVEQGWVDAGHDGAVSIRFDVPAGCVETIVEVRDETVTAVRYLGLASCVLAEDIALNTREGRVMGDLVYAGGFVCVVRAADFGLRLHRSEVPRLSALYQDINAGLRETGLVRHPVEGRTCELDLVLFVHDEASSAGEAAYKVASFFAGGALDRSPCGTGTCARLAQLHHAGRIAQGTPVRATSLVGTTMLGRVTGLTRVGAFEAVQPEITARAFMTGRHDFVLDPADPLPTGFVAMGS